MLVGVRVLGHVIFNLVGKILEVLVSRNINYHVIARSSSKR